MLFAELFANFTWVSVLLFIVGVVLMILEMAHPGFGICGIAGIIVFIIDIVITAKSLSQAFLMLGIIFAVILIIFIVCVSLMSHGKFPSKLVLKESENRAAGFSASSDSAELIGQSGKCITALRPSGKAEISGEVYDVVSGGDFIEAGTDIVVCEVSGNRISVKIK